MFRPAYPSSDKPRYTTRYVYADTTLSTHGSSAGNVRINSEERSRLRQMAEHLERCCNDLDAAGYEVIAIAPIVSGRTAYTEHRSERDYPGHGYSVTDGLIITGRLREQSATPVPEIATAAQPEPANPYHQPGLTVPDYRRQSRQYLAHSRHYLAGGEPSRASEYGWAAAVWMFKAVAEAQGWPCRHQDDLPEVARRVRQWSGDHRVGELYADAGRLLTFSGTPKRYLPADAVGSRLDRMAELLDILEPLTANN